MTFLESVTTCFRKYVTFSGRAARSEFWWFFLFNMIANAVLSRADGSLFSSGFDNAGPLASFYSAIIFIPTLAVQVRRLHDLDKSGWWYLIILVPIVGWIVLLVWNVSEGTIGDNRFGPSTRSRGPSADKRPPKPPRGRPVKERESTVPSVKRTPTIRRR